MAAYQQQSQTPDTTLDALKADLNRKKQTASSITQEIAELNESISILEPLTKEIDQILESYNQALKNLKCERDDFQNYLSSKGAVIIGKTSPEAKKSVGDEIKEFDDSISERNGESENKHNEAYTNYNNAKLIFEERQNDYNNLKGYQKHLEGKIKESKTLKDGAEKEYGQNKIIRSYFLVHELEVELPKIDIKTPEAFEQALNDASLHLYEAKDDLIEKTEQWEIIDKQYREEQRELDTLRKNRREEILKNISDIPAGSGPSEKV